MSKIQHSYRAIGGSFGLADGGNTSILALFNKAGSPFIVLVDRAWILTAQLSAVSGAGVEVDLERITALTEENGAAGALEPLDTNSADDGEIATNVRVYGGGSPTAGNVLVYRAINNDEVSQTGQSPLAVNPMWEATGYGPNEGAIVLKPGQGVDMQQVTSDTSGQWVVGYDIRVWRVRGR